MGEWVKFIRIVGGGAARGADVGFSSAFGAAGFTGSGATSAGCGSGVGISTSAGGNSIISI